MKFQLHIFSMLLLISVYGLAQNVPGSDAKKQTSELTFRRHVRGFVYCPSGSADSAQMSLRSHMMLSAQVLHVRTDKTGYFDFGNVPVGKYELVAENNCSETAGSVNKFEVTVQSGTAATFKDCLPEEIIIKLKRQSSPEISYRSTKNASCG